MTPHVVVVALNPLLLVAVVLGCDCGLLGGFFEGQT